MCCFSQEASQCVNIFLQVKCPGLSFASQLYRRRLRDCFLNSRQESLNLDLDAFGEVQSAATWWAAPRPTGRNAAWSPASGRGREGPQLSSSCVKVAIVWFLSTRTSMLLFVRPPMVLHMIVSMKLKMYGLGKLCGIPFNCPLFYVLALS